MSLVILKSIFRRPNYEKVQEWGRLLTITGGAQAAIQAIGLVCGILVVRILPTQEYAFYTIANTMLGTMTILADGGIAKGVLAIGGKVWQDRQQLGNIVATGYMLRKRFAILSLAIAIPILAYLLIRQQASWLTTLLIIASVIPAFTAALSDTLMEITPKLHQDIYSLQKNQIKVSGLRLILNLLMLFVFPFASMAILCSGIPRAFGNLELKKIAKKFIENGSPDKAVEREITQTVKRIMPSAIFYCLTGQITIWIISLTGSSTSLAEIGALGRITTVFTLFNTVFTILVVPRYARLSNHKYLLLKNYLFVLITTVIILGVVCLTVYYFSHNFLSILGSNYLGLKKELFIYVFSTCIGLLSGLHLALSSSRGWFINPSLNISYEMMVLVSGIFIFDLSSLEGVLFYNLYLYVAYLLQYLFYFNYCINTKPVNDYTGRNSTNA